MSPNDSLSKHLRLDAEHAKALAHLGIKTVSDLLYHLPARYEDISAIQAVGNVTVSRDAVVYGKISGLKTRKSWKSKRPTAEGYIEDGTAKMKIIWFNQPYLAKMLREGAYVKLAGKVAGTAEKPYLANPEIEIVPLPDVALPFGSMGRRDESGQKTGKGNIGSGTLFPIYPETKGITSKWIYHTVQKLFRAGVLDALEDPLPPEMRERYNLPELKTALVWIHAPKKATHTEAARKRFAFEEVFYIQLAKQQERAEVHKAESYEFATDKAHIAKFTSRFSFRFTAAQERAIDVILADFKKGSPMSRLLEGDVGSGKTAVAATTAYAVATSRPDKTKDWGNLQVAYMAPTEILARQHFLSFIEFFGHLPIQIGLITGSGCMKFPSKVSPTEPTTISRAQLLPWVKNGEIPILIGTHALIAQSVEWKHLAYVIIDEQHRFGTRQRRALAQKNHKENGEKNVASENGRMHHLLSMTATPIPRTLALTIYGDLDLTLLDEMPKGRKPIKTSVVTAPKRSGMYKEIEVELKAGRQAYVICPRIDEPDPEKLTAMIAKSVKEEAVCLKKDIFQDWNIAILHSKMTPKEKDSVMQKFKDHEIDILVATSVVEVGVNVPNATVILIEGAERFGLAQLHQLRGRVIRSNHQAYCYAYTDSRSKKTLSRLKALTTAKNGFELAEYDLAFRGSGELYGGKQWGLTDLGMEAIKNPRMVAAARTEAQTLISEDPTLSDHPAIAKRVSTISHLLHFE